FLHLAADGGLGLPEQAGGSGEAALFDHLDEDQGVVEIVGHWGRARAETGLCRRRDDYSLQFVLIKYGLEAYLGAPRSRPSCSHAPAPPSGFPADTPPAGVCQCRSWPKAGQQLESTALRRVARGARTGGCGHTASRAPAAGRIPCGGTVPLAGEKFP